MRLHRNASAQDGAPSAFAASQRDNAGLRFVMAASYVATWTRSSQFT